MEEKSTNKLKYVIAAIGFCLLLVGSSSVFFFIGRVTSPKKQASQNSVESSAKSDVGTQTSPAETTEEVKKVTGETIAVVNLDEGVKEDSELNLYAKDIMDTVKMDCVITSLAEARKGLASGKYGAFVIIPADFSQSVVSLQSTPKKATIQYCVNSELDAEHQQKVLYNTLHLVNTLNDDVSYIYLNAILKDFHTAQDVSTTLMNNDKATTSSILDIQPIQLSQVVNPEKLTQIQSPTTITLEDESSKVVTLSDSIVNSYTTYINDKASEYSTLNTSLTNQISKVDVTNLVVSSKSISTDSYKNLNFEDNEDKYDEDRGLFESDVKDATAKETLSISVQKEVDTGVYSVKKDVASVLVDLQNDIDAIKKEYSDRKSDTSDELVALNALVEKYETRIEALTDESYWNKVAEDAAAAVTKTLLGTGSSDDGIIPTFEQDSEKNELIIKVNGKEHTMKLSSYLNEDGSFNSDDFVKALNEKVNTSVASESDKLESDMKKELKDIIKCPDESNGDSQDKVETAKKKKTSESTDSSDKEDTSTEEDPIITKIEKLDKKISGKMETVKENANTAQEQSVKVYKIKEDVKVSKMDEYATTFASTYQKKIKKKNQLIKTNQEGHATYISEYAALINDYKSTIESNETTHSSVTDSLSNYQLDLNYQNASIANSLKSIQKLGDAMSSKITTYDTETQTYTSAVYDAASDNQTNLIEQMEDAQKESESTVNTALASAKALQSANSAINQKNLLEFSRSLSYTRIGKNQYRLAYRFIVSPFELEKILASN